MYEKTNDFQGYGVYDGVGLGLIMNLAPTAPTPGKVIFQQPDGGKITYTATQLANLREKLKAYNAQKAFASDTTTRRFVWHTGYWGGTDQRADVWLDAQLAAGQDVTLHPNASATFPDSALAYVTAPVSFVPTLTVSQALAPTGRTATPLTETVPVVQMSPVIQQQPSYRVPYLPTAPVVAPLTATTPVEGQVFVQKGDLWYVNQIVIDTFAKAGNALTFNYEPITASPPDPADARVDLVVGGTGGAWTQMTALSATKAVLVLKSSMGQPTMKLVVTAKPDVVRKLAGGMAATHAVLMGPAALLAAAPAQGPVLAKLPASATPSWVLPVAIGGVVVVAAGAIWYTSRKKTATPNRRRRAA